LLAGELLSHGALHAQIMFRNTATTAPSTHISAGGAASHDDCGSISPGIPAGNVGGLVIGERAREP